MHLRLVRAQSGGQLHRYAQLVESFRRDDGMPSHRIIASLGELDDRQVENLRLALAASRAGRQLVLPPLGVALGPRVRITANLHYLDLAVLLRFWDSWGLTALLDRLLGAQPEQPCSPSSVVKALVLHRCTAPGSKLDALRWFPTTALPELLDLDARHFNNTRVHRVLDALDRAETRLQEALPPLYQRQQGPSKAFFMDVTDTWFEGRGCDLAERDRTKEGLRNRFKVGIVLLCNEHGYPLRWKVVAGKRRDPTVMGEMVQQVEKLTWLGQTPLVCDRAMGQASSVSKLVRSRLRFLTAAFRTEIEAYTQDVPHQAFEALSPEATSESLLAEIEEASQVAVRAGMRKVDDRLFVLDLGVKPRELLVEPEPLVRGPHKRPNQVDDLQGGPGFLALARFYQDQLDHREVKNQAALAAREGLTRARISQMMSLLKLNADVQERVLAGEYGPIPERALKACLQLPTGPMQRRLLEEEAKALGAKVPTRRTARRRRARRESVPLRLVLYFNPQMFAEQRALGSKHRRTVQLWVDDVNRRLRRTGTRTTLIQAQADVLEKLSSLSMLGLYEVKVTSDGEGQTANRVVLVFNEVEWRRRRRHDGFVLLIAHPELPGTAEEVVALYRAKDVVEKDFQMIKSEVKVRPVYHHTDGKVRAHVTLCMLALLLEKSLQKELKKAGCEESAPSCLEALKGCHLNQLGEEGAPHSYLLTDPSAAQTALLSTLAMLDLLDSQEVTAQIHPRPPASAHRS